MVQRALSLMRCRPDHRFTVEELAKNVGSSRAVLARRFVEALGLPPKRALFEIRMESAARLLVSSDEGLAAISDAVGYDSEFSFSRAFFRYTNMRPGQFRRRVRSLHFERGGSSPVKMAA